MGTHQGSRRAYCQIRRPGLGIHQHWSALHGYDPKPHGANFGRTSQVPDPIKKARYNLYLIEHDHSYGVHNGNYSRFLLQVARDQVNTALQ